MLRIGNNSIIILNLVIDIVYRRINEYQKYIRIWVTTCTDFNVEKKGCYRLGITTRPPFFLDICREFSSNITRIPHDG